MAGIDAEHLRRLMEKDGATVVHLAEQTGISRQYLGDILAGRRQLKRKPDLVKKLAVALNVPVSMLERRAYSDEPEQVV